MTFDRAAPCHFDVMVGADGIHSGGRLAFGPEADFLQHLGMYVATEPWVQKVFVEPGESKPVSITIDPAATNHLQRLGLLPQGFVTKPGQYTIYVGNSADHIPHTATLTGE